MKKITLIASVIALVLLVYLIGSVTRSISSIHDNKLTFIRNSKGNYWEANSTNIQLAIDDLDSGGTVWLPGARIFEITQTIIVNEGIMLDMGGASFKLPEETNIRVVELKNKAGIRNGDIDVAGHRTWHDSYTAFLEPNSCIFLNANSYIESATIENMYLDSIGLGYNEPDYYDDYHSGRGYGIHFYAGDQDTPQRISGVTVRDVYFRSFKHAIFLQNERGNSGSEEAHIDGNTFDYLFFHANEVGINMSRNPEDTSRQKSSLSGNVFNMMQFQSGWGSWWGGEEIAHQYILISGYNNIFTNVMGWDAGHLRVSNGEACIDVPEEECVEVIFTEDSKNTFISGRCGISDWYWGTGKYIDEGTNNTRFSVSSARLYIENVTKHGT
ncbi:hypothetical protein K8R43_06360 [archaeon]|nr:hypothetical protein [archaeon]